MFAFVPLSSALPYWPKDLFGDPGGLLDEIGVTDFTLQSDDSQLKFTGTVAFLDEIELKIPSCETLSVAFLSTSGFTQVPFAVQLEPTFELSFTNLNVTLRLRSNFLKPAHQDSAGKWVPTVDSSGNAVPAEIVLAGIAASLTADGDIDVTGAPSLTLPPLQFGNTGVVLEMSNIALYLSTQQSPPPGAQPGFKGVAINQAKLHLSGVIDGVGAPDSVTFGQLLIGNDGFSGSIAAQWTSGVGQLFGMPFMLKSLFLAFQQNVPTGSSIKGAIKLPFFDHPVDVEIGITASGDLTVALDSTTGLATLSIAGVLDLELDSLKFEVDAGVLTATLSGKLTPTVPGLNWPAIDLKNLKIDSKGNVQLPGGWLDLPSQYGLDFYGFQVDITKFGMGRNQDGTKWIGFSGGVKLVDGLPAGVSVDGLRITADDNWGNAKISFNGVGVELDVPDVLYFKGHVAYRELTDPSGATVHRFDGSIKLLLRALKLEIDGALVVGSVAKTATAPAYNFFAIYVDAELATGIPLGTTGIAFYGFAGLLAIDMTPDKHPDETWYDVGPTGNWYKRSPIGVTDLTSKWRNQADAKAFGAGVTLGTYADNGYTFNGKVLLAIVFPGPIILLEGMANMLKDRAKLGDDPMFRALAVIDENAGSFLIGLDAKYQFGANGELITISGGAEAFYAFNDPQAWHIYLGEDAPPARRIQAKLFALLDANAYFMLDAHQLAMGAWVGFDKTYGPYGPLSVTLQAWAEGKAIVSFKPGHFHGDLWLHGAVALKAFGFGLGLTIDADIAADVFQPMDILGEFSVGIKLPWPLNKKKIAADVSIEWGPKKAKPPVPIALKDVAVEHFKASARWPLPAVTPPLLVPNFDGGDGYLTTPPAPDPNAAPPAGAPVVPLDCRPSLAFGRNVHDDAQVGLIVQPPDPATERIGDPQKNEGPVQIRYGLKRAQLDRWDTATSAWIPVAGQGTGIANLPALFGTWAPIPGGNGVGQNKLLLWSKTAFDHTRDTGAEWGDWFAGAHKGYPCFAVPATVVSCVDFEKLGGKVFPSPMTHPDNAGVHFVADGHRFVVSAVNPPIAGKNNALQTSTPGVLTIKFDQPVNGLHIVAQATLATAAAPLPVPLSVSVVDKTGATFGPFAFANNVVDVAVPEVTSAVLTAHVPGAAAPAVGTVHLFEVCGDFSGQAATLAAMQSHNENAAAVWKAVGDVLAPYTNYRLTVATAIDMSGDYSESDAPTQYGFFQTGGPPGLGAPSVPAGAAVPQEFHSGLGDLARYVNQTVPPTVPATGEKPLLPRPVYRGYDAGVLFNEDYVDLMYRLAGRDLSLALYDRNNLPVRDGSGRLVVRDDPWGVAPALTLSASEQQWLSLLGASGCVAAVDQSAIPHDQTLTAGAEAQILDPDTVYDARLVPLLVHEDFGQLPAATAASGSGQKLGRWHVEDLAATGGPSQWKIDASGSPPAYRVIQSSAVHDAAAAPSNVEPLGTLLVLDNSHPGLPAADPAYPSNWSDCRIGLYLRSSAATGSIGAAFRYQGTGTFYLVVLDLQNGRLRLVSVSGGAKKILGDAAFSTAINRDYHLVIEAIGPSLRAYVDDALILDLTDATIAKGGLALHCNGNAGAAFSDVQVHDFSDAAVSVYRFGFTTSAYVDFFHHLHSFDDRCWVAQCTLADADVAAIYQNSTANATAAVADAEARAFERLAGNALGAAAAQPAGRFEVTRIERTGATAALLVRSPEPVDWTRASFALFAANQIVPSSLPPGAVKLVAAVLGAAQPSGECVTLLVRQSLSLTGYRIDKRVFSPAPPPGSTLPIVAMDDPASAWTSIYTFAGEPNAPDGTLIKIYSGNPDNSPPPAPRTLQRFRAASGQPGDLQLAADAVDLRIVAPDGTIVHARRILKDGLYAPLQVRLLRKADGTAFFVFPIALPGASFAQAGYRMRMDFRRDNTAADPASIVLSESGQTAPESLLLDIPWSAA